MPMLINAIVCVSRVSLVSIYTLFHFTAHSNGVRALSL